MHKWRDIAACVDTGRATSRAEYQPATAFLLRLAHEFPAGIGFVVIVPPNATPPSEEARRGIDDVFSALAGKLRSVCWVVEGSGFQASMARAVLTGIRMFRRRPYPTYVTAHLQQGCAWTVPHLDDGLPRLPKVPEIVDSLMRSRATSGDP
jgi:hypothetical protein